MKVIVGFILCLIILATGGVIYIFSGMYDVSVENRDKGISRWILESTMENSVEHHARNVEIPSLDDSTMILKGYVRYSRMCGCHGSPGQESNRSFNPEPPELYKTANEWQPNELFWIVKNGIKMSAMPSFSGRASDDEIWETVAFLRVLPKINPEQYKTMDSKAKAAGFIEKR
ncbi:MAG: cytochrome c [Ignavibacteriaceae bacterium]